MTSETISIETARNLMITAQGLSQLPQQPVQKQDVLAAIRRMGALQIDTIHVISRSPYLVLWSRLGDYNPDWLDELLVDGSIFEYWSHAMCFIPIEDYRLYRRSMLNGTRGWGDVQGWLDDHAELVEEILARIRQEGGLRSADFKNTNKPPGGWWNWKDEKTALECLFIQGELMISHRRNFQRVYDLRERILPDWEDGPDGINIPDKEQVLLAHTLQAVKALGIALADWVPDYFRLPKTGNLERLETLANQSLLHRVAINGLPGPAFRHPDAIPSDRLGLTTVLSPFDPLVWDRQRLRDLFGFDYTIEVYTPAEKRAFGYFTLPILHHGAIVGRLDPKAHRKEGLFEIKALAFEQGVEITDELLKGLGSALHLLATWHGTPELVIRRTEPDGLEERLMAD